MISLESVLQLESSQAFPTSLTPIQIAKRVFDDVRDGELAEEGRGARCDSKRLTWSTRERTVDV